jgi:hypothetical protein
MKTHVALRSMILVAVALASRCSLPPALGDDAPANPDLSRKPAYWRDPRFEAEVSLPQKKQERETLMRPPTDRTERGLGFYRAVRLVRQAVVPVRTLTQAIQEKTGVQVLLRGDWMRDPLVLPAQGSSPAREWMDDLVAAFGGQWMKVGEAWVLARRPTEAEWTALSKQQRDGLLDENVRALFGTLTEAKWQAIAQAERLELFRFERPQQQAVFSYLRLQYYDPALDRLAAPGPEAIMAREVYLKLEGVGKQASLVIVAPGAVRPYRAAFPFYDAQTGQLRWGVPPPR